MRNLNVLFVVFKISEQVSHNVTAASYEDEVVGCGIVLGFDVSIAYRCVSLTVKSMLFAISFYCFAWYCTVCCRLCEIIYGVLG